jgi:hypothetical protein
VKPRRRYRGDEPSDEVFAFEQGCCFTALGGMQAGEIELGREAYSRLIGMSTC